MAVDAALLMPLGPRGPQLAYEFDCALNEGRASDAAQLMIGAGDRLAQLGLGRRARAAYEAAFEAAEQARATRLVGDLAWRLGQIHEAMREFRPAQRWYERASEQFDALGSVEDQAIATLALGRTRLKTEGAAGASWHFREAIALARAVGDDALIAAAMEATADALFELNEVSEALASAREAARLYSLVHDEQGVIRSTICVAECELAQGHHIRAIQTLEPVEQAMEGVGADDETRGRGLGLVSLFYLNADQRDEAAEAFTRAIEYLETAGDTSRRARLLLDFARAISSKDGPGPAVPLFRAALQLFMEARDDTRIGPAAYSLARALFDTDDHIGADEAVDEALAVSQRLGDLEGLDVCTELAVQIAVRMGQGALAIERFELAARVRGELGDSPGEMRYLLRALEAAVNIPGLDAISLAELFMEALRKSGTAFLGPAEISKVAEMLSDADRPGYASEVMVIKAYGDQEQARHEQAARAFAQAAVYAIRAEQPSDAQLLYDQAISIGDRLRLPQTDGWRIERDAFTLA